MEKPQALRAAIVAAIPSLAVDPDRLRMWVDKGRVRMVAANGNSFAWEYTLSVYLDQFAGSPALMANAINQWLRTAQPELVTPGAIGYTFEADIIDAGTYDLMFDLPLSEDALVTATEDGGWQIETPGDPTPLMPDDLPLAGEPALLRQIWHNAAPDERILPLADD